jgi:hypothetical protein
MQKPEYNIINKLIYCALFLNSKIMCQHVKVAVKRTKRQIDVAKVSQAR